MGSEVTEAPGDFGLLLGLARLRGERIVPKGFKGRVPLQGGEADYATGRHPTLRMFIEILDPETAKAIPPETSSTGIAQLSRTHKRRTAYASAPSMTNEWEALLEREGRPVFQAGLHSLLGGAAKILTADSEPDSAYSGYSGSAYTY